MSTKAGEDPNLPGSKFPIILTVSHPIFMRNFLFILSLLLIPPIANAQEGIDANDPIHLKMNDWIKQMESKHVLSPWEEIETPELRALLPDVRFVTISVQQNFGEDIAGQIHYRLILAFTGVSNDLVSIGPTTHYNPSFKDFAEVLRIKNVIVSSEDDAMKVWNAFYSLSPFPKQDTNLKGSEHKWIFVHRHGLLSTKLHINYELNLNQKNMVVGATEKEIWDG